MTIIAVIPARGGSKRIPRKNIADCAGVPLLAWTARAAQESARLDRVILSTDDAEIAEIGRQYGVEVPFFRPDNIADDKAPMLPVLQHLVDWLYQNGVELRALVLLQPTSPLRTSKHIDEAIELFLESNCESVVSVVEVPHQFNPFKIMHLTDEGYVKPYMQDAPGMGSGGGVDFPTVYGRNGPAIVVTAPEVIRAGQLYGKKCVPYVMSFIESVDVDEWGDMEMAACLLRKKYS